MTVFSIRLIISFQSKKHPHQQTSQLQKMYYYVFKHFVFKENDFKSIIVFSLEKSLVEKDFIPWWGQGCFAIIKAHNVQEFRANMYGMSTRIVHRCIISLLHACKSKKCSYLPAKWPNNINKYQPSGAGGTRSPPATPHRLQHLPARLIQNGWQGLETG